MSDPTLALAERVVEIADALQIRTALIGAAALAVHGYTRGTQDLDLATAVPPEPTLRQFARALENAGIAHRLRLPDEDDPLPTPRRRRRSHCAPGTARAHAGDAGGAVGDVWEAARHPRRRTTPEQEGDVGLKFLKGERWADVTREERVFCMHLHNRIVAAGTADFVQYLRDKLGCDLDPGANWEVAFEACFYRDLWYHGGRKGELYSPKRTFDLALFSDDAIVVIEAKAQQAFDSEQLQTFCADREAIRAVTDGCEVLLVGLCSSKHEPSDEAEQCFDGKIVTWAALAEHFGNDVDLQRADHIYEPGAFSSFGQNNAGGHMSGAELLAAFRRGERFLVGRAKGGLDGPLLAEDVATGRWKTQKYETNSDEEEPPNRNWFWLADFAVRVTQAGHRGNAGDEAARRG